MPDAKHKAEIVERGGNSDLDGDTGLPGHLRLFAEATDDEFRVDIFIQEYLKKPEALVDPHVALTELGKELRSAKRTLRNRLIDLLNKNYKDFVGLPGMLEGTSDSVSVISRELESIKDQVSQVHRSTVAVLEGFKSATERRKALKARQTMLEMLQLARTCYVDLKDLLDKYDNPSQTTQGVQKFKKTTLVSRYRALVSRQIQSLSLQQGKIHVEEETEAKSLVEAKKLANSEKFPKNLSASTTLLERAARQMVLMKVAVDTTKGFTISEGIQMELPNIELRLLKALRSTLFASIRSKSLDETRQCLRAFHYCDATKQAEEVVLEKVVRPIVEEILTKEALIKAQTGDSKLIELFDSLLTEVKEACRTVLLGSVFPLTSYKFVTRVIAANILTTLQKNGGEELFAPYIPARFLRHYQASRHLLASLVNLCPDRTRKQFLLASPEVDKFESRWSLPVYFQLRYQELRKALDDAVSAPPKASALLVKSGFLLDTTQALWKSVNRCWEDGVFIHRLTHRFFKATLQLFRRYISWITSGISPDPDPSRWSPAPAVRGLLALEADLSKLIRLTSPTSPNSNSIINTICTRVESHHQQQLKDAESVRSLISAGFRGVSGELENARAQVAQSVALRVSRDCSSALVAGVPRIKQKYSMTGNAPPTGPSGYVKGVFEPLRENLEIYRRLVETQGDGREGKDGGWLVGAVGRKVVERYLSASEDLLQVVKKTEAILTRLNKKRRPTKANGGMSDADKIRLQLRLDVEFFASELRALGGDTDSDSGVSDALGQLRDMVKPDEKAG